MLDFRLYAVIDAKYINNPLPLNEISKQLCEGGATIIQLRDKNSDAKIILENAITIREITWKFNVPFIVNDRLDIAIASKADGVHLGENDLPIDYARKLFPRGIIGSSADTPQKAIDSEKRGADYIGVGCLFPSNTKPSQLVPLDVISKIKLKVKIPVVGIGGINIDNFRLVFSAGADGICLAHDLLNNINVAKRTEEFKSKLQEKKY